MSKRKVRSYVSALLVLGAIGGLVAVVVSLVSDETSAGPDQTVAEALLAGEAAGDTIVARVGETNIPLSQIKSAQVFLASGAYDRESVLVDSTDLAGLIAGRVRTEVL